MEYIISHDFGTSSVKSSLFSTFGTLIKSVSTPLKTMSDKPGYAVQDARDWWRIFCANNKALLSKAPRGHVLCVSFSTAFPSCLLVDKDVQPLYPVMIWQDTRALEQAERISEALPSKYTARSPGGKMSPDRALVKLLWMKENEPELYDSAHKMLPSASNYVIMKMTGRAVCDYAASYGTAMIERGKQDWCDEILGISGVSRELLPELCERTDIVGCVNERISEECGLPAGTRIVCGTVDSDCTSIGGGLINPGDAFFLGGTSAEIDALAPDGRKIGRPTSSSGSSLSWMRNNIGILEKITETENDYGDYSLINKRVAEAPVGSGGVIFIPYLAGERGLRNDPLARGSFTGISLSTSRECLMRAVVEGIGFNLNLLLENIRAQGIEVTELPIVGGLGKGAEIRQIFADIMNVTLITYQHMDEAAVAGAAVIGGMGLGIYSDISAIKKFMRFADKTVPNEENHKKYLEIMPVFEKTYQALKTLYNE